MEKVLNIIEENKLKINCYVDMVLESNKNMNLTGAKSKAELMDRHIVDSLAILNYIDLDENMRILDMGTGAGFPGVPLAICTNSSFVLADSLKKRIKFLESVKGDLGLDNVELSSLRAEEFGRKVEYRESFDIVVSRAVAPLNLLLEYIIPNLKVGGRFYAYKSNNCDEEIIEAQKAIEVLSIKQTGEYRYKINSLDDGTIELILIEFTKLKITDDKYPRRIGIPAKRPIK